MNKRVLALGSACVVIATSVFGARTVLAPAPQEFEDLEINLQVNPSDEELAVIIAMEVYEEFIGLEVADPAGNPVLEARSAYPLGLGLGECSFETRADLDVGLAAYPEGDYRVVAYAADGSVYQGVAHLSHQLPPRPRFVMPTRGSIQQAGDLQVRWHPTDADQVRLEVEGDELALDLTLPGHMTSFVVPASVLTSGEEVKLTLTAYAENGNKVEEEMLIRIR